MRKNNRLVKGLICRECGRSYPKEPLHICEYCFGPLEVDYDYKAIARSFTARNVKNRDTDMWRYRELLPVDEEPTIGLKVGYTPFIKADNLAKVLKVRELYVKNDSVSFPSLSFKDRVVAVAVSKAHEFGFDTVACASTGNLANSLAAIASATNFRSYIFIPADLEQGKILGTLVFRTNLIKIKGTYDEVNRLCSEIAGKYDWAFVNINIRPYYAEGSKTFGFEIAEQLGWKLPKHIVVPMAGGSLICKIYKAFEELHKLGLIEKPDTKFYGAQAAGCAPIVTAVKERTNLFKPVLRPDTIAKSLAIGNPADGFYAIQTINETGGWAEDATDEEIVWGMKILAETEGIFTETAGGVTIAAAKKLIDTGRIPKDESIVISITGNGLKTQEALKHNVKEPETIGANLSDFDELIKHS